MRAIQIIAGLDLRSGGPSISVPRLAQAVCEHGVNSAVFAVAAQANDSSDQRQLFSPDFQRAPFLNRLDLSQALARAIDAEARNGAILHSHGLWLAPNLYPAASARRFNRPLLTAPRGMLAPAALAFSRAKKELVWALAQKRALQAVTCFHATSQEEAEDIRRQGFRQPIALVPNGVDVAPADQSAATKAARGPIRTALYFGRLHPKKAVDRLITAWARVEPHFSDWRLRIIGPSDDGYADQLRALQGQHKLAHVSIEGPIYGPAKDLLYQSADLFILPTLSENFGMAVAEALANGTPVICTKGAPWSGLTAHGCGWWIEHGVEPLRETLSDALAQPRGALDAMGARGHAWMMRDFSWSRIGAEMADVYHWLDNAGPLPDCVQW
jgi:glycosyltransferase involved in cell wall biosynthesis